MLNVSSKKKKMSSPVQGVREKGDVLVPLSPRNESGGNILYQLETVAGPLADTSVQYIAVIEFFFFCQSKGYKHYQIERNKTEPHV